MALSIKKLLVSQPKPTLEKSPYFDIAEKYGVDIDFRPFINFWWNVGFLVRIGDFQRVETKRIGGVGWVEIDDVVQPWAGDEFHVVDGEVAVWVDDGVALAVKNVAEGE